MYTVLGRGADLNHFLRFDHGPILVLINLQQRQAQYYGMCTRARLTQTHLYVEYHSSIFKVFGMTRP